MHHLVVPVNLASKDDLALITEQLRLFVDRKIALRFGVVPLAGTPEGLRISLFVKQLQVTNCDLI